VPILVDKVTLLLRTCNFELTLKDTFQNTRDKNKTQMSNKTKTSFIYYTYESNLLPIMIVQVGKIFLQIIVKRKIMLRLIMMPIVVA